MAADDGHVIISGIIVSAGQEVHCRQFDSETTSTLICINQKKLLWTLLVIVDIFVIKL